MLVLGDVPARAVRTGRFHAEGYRSASRSQDAATTTYSCSRWVTPSSRPPASARFAPRSPSPDRPTRAKPFALSGGENRQIDAMHQLGCSSRTGRRRRPARGWAGRPAGARRAARRRRAVERERVAGANTASWPDSTARAAADRPLARQHVGQGVEVGRHGRPSRAPGATVAWATVIGVWVEPGPRWPATSPAISRTRAPPSAEDSSVTWSPSRFW